MKQIIASVLFDILSYTIGNIISCIFKFNVYNCKGIQASACRSYLHFLLCFFFDVYLLLFIKLTKLKRTLHLKTKQQRTL